MDQWINQHRHGSTADSFIGSLHRSARSGARFLLDAEPSGLLRQAVERSALNSMIVDEPADPFAAMRC